MENDLSVFINDASNRNKNVVKNLLDYQVLAIMSDTHDHSKFLQGYLDE